MASSGVHFIFLFALLSSVGSAKEFLGAKTKISSKDLQEEIQGVLGEVLGLGHGVVRPKLNKIRSSLMSLFRTLPKNSHGKLSAAVMRYAVRRYFSQQHAWIVKGFEPHALQVVENGTDIVGGKVPGYVRSLLEVKFAHGGFALDDVVAMVAVIEKLAFDESVRTLNMAYHLNSVEKTAMVETPEMLEILTSYMFIELLEGSDDKEEHLSDKANIKERYPNWDDAYLFLLDIVGSDGFGDRFSVNPFRQKLWGFEDVARLTERISEEFGVWSNYECHDMKDILSAFDVHKTGRVKLADFYQSTDDGIWQFLEPSAFLRQNGALDESSSYHGPHLIIPNYIAGMSNCVTSAPYYAICCLNECDHVFQHLEGTLHTPAANQDDIIHAIESMPINPVTVTPALRNKLQDVAGVNDGKIPIHGRLFAQWLHYAFPRECPYPHMAGTVTPKTQAQWREEVGVENESVTEDEIIQHKESEAGRREYSPDAGEEMWSLEEVLMPASTPSDKQQGFLLSAFLRHVMQLMMCISFGAFILKEIAKLVKTSPGGKVNGLLTLGYQAKYSYDV